MTRLTNWQDQTIQHFPLSNFEKKKASLAINIFSEKTIGALEINDKKDAAVFVGAIT